MLVRDSGSNLIQLTQWLLSILIKLYLYSSNIHFVDLLFENRTTTTQKKHQEKYNQMRRKHCMDVDDTDDTYYLHRSYLLLYLPLSKTSIKFEEKK